MCQLRAISIAFTISALSVLKRRSCLDVRQGVGNLRFLDESSH